MLSQQETHRTQMIHSPIFLPKFAMAFHIRKLLDESDPDSRCQTNFCDPEKNLNGSCPINCMKICPDCCRIPIYYYAPTPPMLENVIGQTPSTLSKFLTVFLSILATSFLFFACYIIYKIFFTRYNRRRPSRSSSADNDEPGPEEFLDVDRGPVFDHPTWYIRTVGLDPSVIGSIAIVKYEKGRGLIEGTECSVCLTEFQENERLRLLPKCNHAFHVPCIDTWLRAHTNCPMCRARIASDTTPTSSSENGIAPNLSGVDETNQTGASGAEDDDSGLRVGIEEEFDEYQASVGLKMNEIVENGIQPARRSVSMDSLPASAIRKAIANASSAQSDETSGRESVKKLKETDGGTIAKSAESSRNVSRLVGSPSSLRPSRTGSSSSIKRSVSCSARILIPRYSGKSSNPIVHPRML